MPSSSISRKSVPLSISQTLCTLDIDKVSESNVYPINWKEIFSIFPILIKSGLPTSVTSIANFVIPLVCLMFVGKYGTAAELAGVSLGNTFCDALSFAIFNSINQGFGVVASHLFGARKYKEVGLLYQRNICMTLCINLFSILIMCFIDRLLLLLGLDEEVSINTGIYLRCLIPSIISLNIYDCTRFYLTSQELFFFQGAVQFFIAILHVFWCMLLVGHLGLSVRGAAFAKSISDTSAALILIVYVKFNKEAHRCAIPWTKKCFSEWWSHLKQTLSIGANTYVAWISLEASILIVSGLNNSLIIGAHGAAFTLASTFFSITLGNSIAMQAYIGNSVGECHKYKAQKFMIAGLLLNVIYSLVDVAVMLSLIRQLGSLFTSDERVLDIFCTMWFINSLGHFSDTLSNHLTGIFRTIGKEKDALLYHIISYVIIGITCQVVFGLVLGYGYVAIWICIVSETTLICILIGRRVMSLDWDQVIADIKLKVEQHHEMPEEEGFLERKEI